MQTFLIERTIPAAFKPDDPEVVATHCRWATDGYHAIGAHWLGGVVTPDAMWSLVAAEQADDMRRYWAALAIPEADARMRPVVRAIGPFFAAPRP